MRPPLLLPLSVVVMRAPGFSVMPLLVLPENWSELGVFRKLASVRSSELANKAPVFVTDDSPKMIPAVLVM